MTLDVEDLIDASLCAALGSRDDLDGSILAIRHADGE
jgi:hypothetical protein